MDILTFFGFLSTAIALASFVPYYLGIFRGQTQPHMFTWLVWGLITGIGFAAAVSDGAAAGAWVMALTCLFCLSIASLSLRYGEKNITRSDWVAFVAALSAIPLWLITDTPLWSVVLICVIDALGFVPTFRKTWLKPHGEPLMAFFLGACSYGVSLAAMGNLSLVTTLYPLTLIVLNTGFIVMVLLRRRRPVVA